MIEIDENDPNKVWIDRAANQLELAYKLYTNRVEAEAAELRKIVLVPWLKRNGYEFRTGNGTWSVTDPAKIVYLPNGKRNWGNHDYDMNDRLPDDIDRLLRLEIDGSWGNGELGLWMQDYTLEKTKNGGGSLK